jgi:hypothetical protein
MIPSDVQRLKLFFAEGSLQVAIYGPKREDSDGWCCNLSAAEVFSRSPWEIPLEQEFPPMEVHEKVPLLDAWHQRCGIKAAIAKPENPGNQMFLRELIDHVSRKTGLPAQTCRQVANSQMRILAELIQRGEILNTPFLTVKKGSGGKARIVIPAQSSTTPTAKDD